MKIKFPLIFLFGLTASTAFSQVSVTNGAYSQNFDSLSVSGSGVPWADNSSLPGWYARLYPSSSQTGGSIPNNLLNGPQFSNSIAAYGGSGEMALGSGYDNSFSGNGAAAFGVRLVNNTGALVSGFAINYTGEQWSRAANATQVVDKLTFSYQIFDANTGSLAASGWIAASTLDFTSPNAALSAASDLDGNLTGNQATIFGTVTGISLSEGQELWLRWVASDIAASDHDLAIDNLTVNFVSVPEPASFAAFTALAVAGVAGLKRKRRA